MWGVAEDGVREGIYGVAEQARGRGLTLEMALVRVGLGAVFLEPKSRFMMGEERFRWLYTFLVLDGHELRSSDNARRSVLRYVGTEYINGVPTYCLRRDAKSKHGPSDPVTGPSSRPKSRCRYRKAYHVIAKGHSIARG